jgi:hypothetical protein
MPITKAGVTAQRTQEVDITQKSGRRQRVTVRKGRSFHLSARCDLRHGRRRCLRAVVDPDQRGQSPRVLVPPSRRRQPGWWAERRARRARRASGLPTTEHVVEVLDVRPPPNEKQPYEPYFMAVCSADDCGWSSDPVGRDEAHPDPERCVREQASQHSSTITGPRRPLG